ncbi:DUF5519 family protein [soil metagenome]
MNVSEKIREEVLAWDGTESKPHRFNGLEFRVNGHEIGHLHGNRLADLPFPRRVREELVHEGKAQTHHVLPHTGWVSYRIHGEDDVDGALELFRRNYERLTTRQKRAND